jgi:deoxyribose-phosphate aldolase
MSATRIAIGSDHGGFELKEHLRAWLAGQGWTLEDCGTFDASPCDYPVLAAAVARKVADGACGFGIVIDGAGIGSAMAANKVAGVRAALCYDVSSARNAREHNDANVLTLGARLIGQGLAEQIASTFLGTACTEERHLKRVAMIEQSCPTCAPQALQSALARDQERLENPAPPGRASSFQDSAFQGRARAWLTMDNRDNISGEDLERVAARLFELIASGEQRGNLFCFGDVCVDAGVARHFIAAGVGRLSNGLGSTVPADVAKYIDHTLLRPDATEAQVQQLCSEARTHSFASVCVNPYWVKLCAQLLRGSPVKVCTVVGFPLGACVPELKALEARRAIRDGAQEIDMVINIGALKGGDDALVFKDIRGVVDACEDGRALSKVIIETALLSDDEKVRACTAARKARADFVKTSTGFASGGATAEDVALMSAVVREAHMGVKASGGVKSFADFEKMVRAGATRIGASAGVQILKEAAA